MTRSLLLALALAGCATDDTNVATEPAVATNARECTSVHAKVGHTATLAQRSHDVRGTARIVDDCTIELTGFSYDGRGLDVRIYAAPAGDYANGFAISDDLLGTAYDNGTLRVQLPDGMTLDDLDGIAVWCVEAGVSFGDGLFAP